MTGPMPRALRSAVVLGVVATALVLPSTPASSAAPWSTLAAVSDGANSVSEPQLAMAADGRSGFALWVQSVAGHDVVRAARFANGAWAAPVTVSVAGGEAGWPRLAASSDGTSAWAAWSWDVLNPGIDGVQVARYSGGSWGAPTTVTSGALAIDPEITTGSTGATATVIFRQSGNGLRYRVRTFAAGSWSAVADLAAAGAPAFNGHVEQSADGTAAVAVWVRGDAGSQVVQTSRRVNGAWSSPADLSTAGGNTSPDLSVSADASRAAVVWSAGGSPGRIWISRYSAGSWSTAAVVSGTDDAARAVVAASGTGAVLVSWTDATDQVRVRRFSGSWLPPEILDATTSDYVSVSLTDDGRRGIAVWDAVTAAPQETLRARRLTDQVWGATETIGTSLNGGYVAGVEQSGGGATTQVLAALGSTWVAQGSRSVVGPSAPRSLAATRGNASAAISWTAPSDTGGLAVTSYTATASPGGATCTTTTPGCTITGLSNGTSYTVTVKATTGGGAGLGATSAPVTPATVPGAPTAVKGTTKPTTVTAAWTAPASTGGAAITSYTAVAVPGGRSCTTATTSCAITGLTNGKAVRITVTAHNSVGAGPASAPSSAVIPWAGTLKIAATAVQKRDKLRIDVGPDRAKGDYPVVVLKRRANGSFTTYRKATAAGKKEIVLLQLPAGRYKVKVPARFGWKGVVSGVVILVR